MKPRLKAALLWGVVGALAFLVMVQGYELLGDAAVSIPVKVVGAIVVAVATTGLSYVVEGRFAPGHRSESADENETS